MRAYYLPMRCHCGFVCCTWDAMGRHWREKHAGPDRWLRRK